MPALTAAEVHNELAKMAWERMMEGPDEMPPCELLAWHLREMTAIISNGDLYRELWRRIDAKQEAS